MVINKLMLHNFKNFIDAEFEFEPNRTCLIMGSEQSGKTALLEAVRWLISGQRSYQIKADEDLLNADVKKKMFIADKREVFVEMYFKQDGIDQMVRRQMTLFKYLNGAVLITGKEELILNGDVVEKKEDVERYFKKHLPREICFIGSEAWTNVLSAWDKLPDVLNQCIEIKEVSDAIMYCRGAKSACISVLSREETEENKKEKEKVLYTANYLQRMIEEFQKLRNEQEIEGYEMVEEEFLRLNKEARIYGRPESLKEFFIKRGTSSGDVVDMLTGKVAILYLSFILACRKVKMRTEEYEENKLPLFLDDTLSSERENRVLNCISQIDEQIIVVNNIVDIDSLEGINTIYKLEKNLEGTVTTVIKM